ncbi:hypothetical protein PMIN04_011600 [Paraphaeosphaeria minitans]
MSNPPADLVSTVHYERIDSLRWIDYWKAATIHFFWYSYRKRCPWAHARALRPVLVTLQYSYPVALLVFFLVAFTVRSIAASNSNANVAKPTTTGPGGKPLPATDPTRNFVKKTVHDDATHSQKLLFTRLSLFAAATFVGNSAVSVIHALASQTDTWWAGNHVVAYLIGSFFVYCLFLISLINSKPSPTSAHLATWIVAAVLELACDFLRIVILLALIGFYVVFVSHAQRASSRESGSASEITSLLGGAEREGSAGNDHANGSYGSVHPVGGKSQHTEGAPPAWSRPTGAPARSWWEYLKGYKVFFPYLWPSKDRRLQMMVIICFFIVLLQRVVNMLVPNQIGRITDRLEDGSRGNPWQAIMLFIAFRFIQGNNGLLGAIRSTLWIPVGQCSYRELSVAAFEHVHSLSLHFHLGKKTGEILSALGKGSSINTF